MAEAPEHREVNDTAEPTLVPFSGGTFEETETTSLTVVVSRESGPDFIASQRKISYQSDTVFYQQTFEYFLSYPPAERMGGLVGWLARLLGGNFKEEPQDMLQMECVDADSTPPSRSNSGSCRLSLETQKVSARARIATPTHARSLQCCVTACAVSLRCCVMKYSVTVCHHVTWLTTTLTWWDTATLGHSFTRPQKHGGHLYNG